MRASASIVAEPLFFCPKWLVKRVLGQCNHRWNAQQDVIAVATTTPFEAMDKSRFIFVERIHFDATPLTSKRR